MNRNSFVLMLFALSIFIPSLGQVHKYTQWWGVLAYAFLIIGFITLYDRMSKWVIDRLTEKQSQWLALGTLVMLFVVFSVVYPLITNGCDRDEALNDAVTELLAGRYPYYKLTFQGNPITPMPGSILLAAPFVLLGNSAYQNFFWLAALFGMIRAYFEDSRISLLMLWTLIFVSPVIMWEIVTGSDLLSNNLFVLLFFLQASQVIPDPEKSATQKTLSAILMGVAVSSRVTFMLCVPLLAIYLVKKAGWLQSAKYVGILCAVFLLITSPFYIFDPSGFTPTHTGNIFRALDAIFSDASLFIFIATMLFAAFSMVVTYRDPDRVYLYLTFLQGFAYFWILLLVLYVGPKNIVIYDNKGMDYLVVPYFHMIGYGIIVQIFGLFAFFKYKY